MSRPSSAIPPYAWPTSSVSKSRCSPNGGGAALAVLAGGRGAADAEAPNHLAAGVELLHTAGLVRHDIDRDRDPRHGGATLYARVGNALAVLVGDYLFSQAAQQCVAT